MHKENNGQCREKNGKLCKVKGAELKNTEELSYMTLNNDVKFE